MDEAFKKKSMLGALAARKQMLPKIEIEIDLGGMDQGDKETEKKTGLAPGKISGLNEDKQTATDDAASLANAEGNISDDVDEEIQEDPSDLKAVAQRLMDQGMLGSRRKRPV